MSPERMRWDDDERLYQPRIHSRHIRALHQISAEIGEPITVLVDQALSAFVERYQDRGHQEWEAAFPEDHYWPDERNTMDAADTDLHEG